MAVQYHSNSAPTTTAQGNARASALSDPVYSTSHHSAATPM